MTPAPMPTCRTKKRIASRWDTLVPRLRSTSFAEQPLHKLAARAGFDWYRARGGETLGEFLKLSGYEVLALPGFGPAKLHRLCAIADALEPEVAESGAPDTSETDPREILATWGFPGDFPVDLTPLPVRLLHHCEREGINTITELISEWERLGFSGLSAAPKLGERSVRELESFVNALRRGDQPAAARWLPITPDSNGPDLAAALAIVLDSLTDSERNMLSPRLVEERTLEESAEANGVTRERVRQVEAAFLGDIARCLDWFATEREEMLSRWVAFDENFAAGVCHSEYAELVTAAVRELFRDSPRGVARDLAAESALDDAEARLEIDSDLWFGGVNLDRFAVRHVPASYRNIFFERIAASLRFQIDHTSGRAHPRRAGLLRAVKALVADEINPLPLTWLVHLLKETGHFPKVERIDLVRRRSSWRKRDSDLDARILWQQ